MWQTDGGAKQSTRRGGPSLTKDMQTEHELIRVNEWVDFNKCKVGVDTLDEICKELNCFRKTNRWSITADQLQFDKYCH